ncbi:MAG: LLM class flavin-dependent oxidoreductase [Thermoleophilia bacterium]
MISKLSVLYVGSLDLDDIGLEGTAPDARRQPPERFAEAYWTARELAQLMEELGFHRLWTAEHHFQREGYEVFPNLILLNTWLATQTQRLEFGCAFNVLPMWHPIRLAEDYAFADIVTGGRVVLGIARGYHSREVESFGAPMLDQEANRALFEEQVELLVKALTEDSFRHDGAHYTVPPRIPYRGYQLEDVSLVPRPLNRPLELWQAISSGRSIAWMVPRGIKGMVTLTGERILDGWLRQFQEEAAAVGRDVALGEDVCVGVGLYLGDSVEQAMREVEPYHDERYKWFSAFGIVRYTDEEGRQWGSPGAPSGSPRIEDGVAQGAWLCGPPEHVAERIRALEERYPGLDQLMLHWPEGMPKAVFFEQLRRFAAEVVPLLPGFAR